MATGNQKLRDLNISHLIGLERVANRHVVQLVNDLRALDSKVSKAISELLARNWDGTAFNVQAIRLGMARIEQMILDAHREMSETLGRLLDNTMGVETDFQADILARIVGPVIAGVHPVQKLTPGEIAAGRKAQKLLGKTIERWILGLGSGKAVAVRNSVFNAVDAGVNQHRIISGLKSEVFPGFERGMKLHTKTSTHGLTSWTRSATYEINQGLIRAEQWVSTLDTRTTGMCIVRDGWLYTIPDHEPLGHLAPWGEGPGRLHFNCVVGDTRVLPGGRTVRVYSRGYQGKIATIQTASGRVLACTPNHPILTLNGWVAADSLKVGDRVICDGRPVWGVVSGDVDTQDAPDRIKDMAEAALGSGEVSTAKMPSTAEDFHGDGGQGEVTVVSAKGLLGCGRVTTGYQFGVEHPLMVRNLATGEACGFVASGHIGSLGVGLAFAANRVMGSFRQGFDCLRRCSLHAGELLFAAVSYVNPFPFEQALHCVSRAPKELGDFGGTNTRLVDTNDFGAVEINGPIPTGGDGDSVFLEDSTDGVATEAELLGHLLDGSEVPVFADDVIDHRVGYTECHVYNLETSRHWFTAGGIITHNCRSGSSMVLRPIEDMGLYGLPVDEDTRAALTTGEAAKAETYFDWLDRQPPEVIREILGPTRTRLMETGGIDPKEFFTINGDLISLDDLCLQDRKVCALLETEHEPPSMTLAFEVDPDTSQTVLYATMRSKLPGKKPTFRVWVQLGADGDLIQVPYTLKHGVKTPVAYIDAGDDLLALVEARELHGRNIDPEEVFDGS